ncbi:thiol:disulfide interchange protein DsbD [Raoultella sp. BIGb0138]|uniref:protein-disulfide reductase DsbD family protein n=1 Tax=Raoultella sp. BIGb0138 TaxID=2485115 RepID=UPI00104D3937|nr:thioredoxin family protein [Raoultella sp. BIGb0138]TCW16852.1 thiol:disulfide interchange protein DsbD [Raoultella sp. BIGb0138]
MITAMLAAFMGGIILNFMPCVFPVISLKALGLLRHPDNAASARREGLAFLLGVMITMMALAGILLAARAGGLAVGWGFQLQSPLVIALLALVILGAALNLLGVFEVGLAAQRVGALEMGRGAFIRSALTGALAIIVATPCAAPFMASAIGYALVQPPATALAVFFALALGFSAPFTLVSLFPALATLLPRPGAWMDILKRVLAFPMFGAYAWLVWVLAQQAGSGALATLLAASVVLSFAAWLYGIAQQRRYQGKGHKVLFGVTAALALAVIAPLVGLIDPDSAQPGARTSADVAAEKWTPQAVESRRGHGQAIFVNFTASWCITCQVNEKTSLSTQAVKEALAKTGTLYMIADSTKFNPDVDDALNQFGQGGLPLYVVYPADGGPPKVLPQVLTPGIVVNALNQATSKKV